MEITEYGIKTKARVIQVMARNIAYRVLCVPNEADSETVIYVIVNPADINLPNLLYDPVYAILPSIFFTMWTDSTELTVLAGTPPPQVCKYYMMTEKEKEFQIALGTTETMPDSRGSGACWRLHKKYYPPNTFKPSEYSAQEAKEEGRPI